jgi:Tat protein translocase TatB subunit
MFGIGLPEMIVILAVALVVVGPDKLPELAKNLAGVMRELKQAAYNMKAQLDEEGRSVTGCEEVLSTPMLELTADTPQALPGDQWVHEHQPETTAVDHRKIPAGLDHSAINNGPEVQQLTTITP